MTAGVRTHAGACGFEHTCLYLTRAKGVWGERTRLQVPYTHMGHGWGGGCTGAYLFFSLSEVFKEVLPVNRFRDPIGRPCSEQPRSADAFARTVPRTEGKKGPTRTTNRFTDSKVPRSTPKSAEKVRLDETEAHSLND